MSGLRGGLVASIGALAVVLVVAIGAGAASSPHVAKSKFTEHDRALLAKKARQGAKTELHDADRGRTVG